MKGLNYKGEWWLPDEPKIKKKGTLTFDKRDGGKLKIFESFTGKPSMFSNPDYDIVLGNTLSGKHITLYNCRFSDSTISSAGPYAGSFDVEKIHSGWHFPDKDEIKFHRTEFYFPNFENWVNISGFSTCRDGEDISIDYEQPETINTNIRNHNVKIEFKLPKPLGISTKCNLEQKTFIAIESEDLTHIQEHLKLGHLIRNFLTLAMDQTTFPKKIVSSSEVYMKELNEDRKRPAKIYTYHVDGPGKNRDFPREKLNRSQMLFSYEEISENFEKYLNNWLYINEKFEHLLTNYFGVIYSPNRHLQNDFLRFVRGLESYHRSSNREGIYQNKEEYLDGLYSEMVNVIPDELDSNFKDSLKSRLKHHYEHSLRKRFQSLFDELSEILSPIAPDDGQFVDTVIEARNFLIHYSEDSKDKIQNWDDLREDLYYSIQKLRLIVEAILLHEMEIPDPQIKEIVTSTFRYERYCES